VAFSGLPAAKRESGWEARYAVLSLNCLDTLILTELPLIYGAWPIAEHNILCVTAVGLPIKAVGGHYRGY
jgi:hypothetical protein